MEEIKIQNVRPVSDPRTTEKPGGKPQSGPGAFGETLRSAVDRMSALNNQADAAVAPGEKGSAAIKEDISTAREIFDRMMLQKRQLSRLYHRITGSDQNEG
jgi:flagellar hook-basal body complex protein FliE